MAAAKHWTEKLQGFDRRWLFLAMGFTMIFVGIALDPRTALF